MALRFDNKVVVVTGAGGGLGKVYALEYSRRGAKVVVNDLGTTTSGEGNNSRAADVVVDEIKKAGGVAVANYDSVEFGDKIIKTALDNFGKVDIVINNAGILRDVSFMKITDADWNLLYKVHLYGSYSVTKAAWATMRKQGFGRVIMTTSAAGLYGNFGQANYSAMKLALLGLANTLSKEGESNNVFVNTIAPLAGTRMTETVLPGDIVAELKPEYVAPLVLYLTHEDSKTNGQVFEVGAGWVSQVRLQRTKGHFFDLNKSLTPELIQANWDSIVDFSEPSYPTTPVESFDAISTHVEKCKNGGAAIESSSAAGEANKGGVFTPGNAKQGENFVNIEAAKAYTLPPTKTPYTVKDAALYALSVGYARNPLDEKQLEYVYENSANFQVAPTMPVIFPFEIMSAILNNPGLSFNPMQLLHGEQELELKQALPSNAVLLNHAKIANIYDKGKGALVVVEITTTDEKGTELFVNRSSLFIRGLGGFGGERGPTPDNLEPPTNRAPDAIQIDATAENQALLYRWTGGDLNPLHADPSMASMGGFDKPILHGLCTFGFAGKAVLEHFAGWDSSKVKSIRARFSKHVFPGETIVTEMWKVAPNRIAFRCKSQERNEYVLTGGLVQLQGEEVVSSASASSSVAAAPAAPASSGFQSEAIFSGLSSQLKAGGEALVKKVNGVYQFDVTQGDVKKTWFIDLKTGPQPVLYTDKAPVKASVTIAVADEDCVALFTRKLNPQQAFIQQKIKVRGDMKLALKLTELIGGGAKL